MSEATWTGIQYFTIGFKMTEKPFNDVKVRQAILCSMDREGMAKAVGFGVGKANFYPHWGVGELGWDESIEKNALDLEKAKRLLTEAGYANGLDMTLKYISREPDNTLAQFQQQVWAKAGIRVQLQALERLVWLDDMAAGRLEAAIWRGGATLDPDLNRAAVMCGGAVNYSKWCDQEIENLMNQGGQTMDQAQRHEIYKKVLARIQEQAYVGSGVLTPVTLSHAKKVQGVTWRFGYPELNRCWISA